jgi:hypothetical protein
MAGAFVGGWDLSIGVTVATGAPVDFTDGKDQSGADLNTSPNAWSNTKAVVLQAAGTLAISAAT